VVTQIGSCNKLGSCRCRENAFVNGADADICIKNDDTVLNPATLNGCAEVVGHHCI